MSFTVFLCGDVMLGRGIDQVLPHPCDPELYEPYIRDAREYIELAEQAHGPIPRSVDPSYVWGDALPELAKRAPDARIINLETSITDNGKPWPGKGIHYRMHPRNIACLSAARVDCCALANNHVLDFGYTGLEDTTHALTAAGIQSAGAGSDQKDAARPAIVRLPGDRRVIVFAFGLESSGIPLEWAATPDRAGVTLLKDFSHQTLAGVSEGLRAARGDRDLAIASIHWGGNWGFGARAEHVEFAHGLVRAGFDVVHGHSSHHARPIEVYRDKLILYGCGDFIDDYEGIAGYEEYRGDLALMYFPTVEAGTGRLAELEMVPLRIRNFRLNRASLAESAWLGATLEAQCRPFGCGVTHTAGGALRLRFGPDAPPPLRLSGDRSGPLPTRGRMP